MQVTQLELVDVGGGDIEYVRRGLTSHTWQQVSWAFTGDIGWSKNYDADMVDSLRHRSQKWPNVMLRLTVYGHGQTRYEILNGMLYESHPTITYPDTDVLNAIDPKHKAAYIQSLRDRLASLQLPDVR